MEAVFTFHTTHSAIGGEKALLDAGLGVKVMGLPSALGAGCGLCLRVKAEELDRAEEILARAGIKAEGIYYKETAEGKTVYRPV